MSGLQIFFTVLAILVAVASFVINLARTPPDVAVSNLSRWAETMGIHDVPAWLRRQKADEIAYRWARRVLIVLVAIGIIGAAKSFFSSQPAVVLTSPSAPTPTTTRNVVPTSNTIREGQPPFSGLTEFDALSDADFVSLVHKRMGDLRSVENKYDIRRQQLLATPPNNHDTFTIINKKKEDIGQEEQIEFKTLGPEIRSIYNSLLKRRKEPYLGCVNSTLAIHSFAAN